MFCLAMPHEFMHAFRNISTFITDLMAFRIHFMIISAPRSISTALKISTWLIILVVISYMLIQIDFVDKIFLAEITCVLVGNFYISEHRFLGSALVGISL